MTYVDEIVSSALALSYAARWDQALRLLDAFPADARTAAAAAEVAAECDWHTGSALGLARLETADRICGPTWDLAFLRLKHDYMTALRGPDGYRFGPDGKDPQVLTEMRARCGRLATETTSLVRQGWAHMYLGLIADNHFAQRDVSPRHYELALRAATGGGDDLLAREALRHLGDHDRNRGDLTSAGQRWELATTLGARSGLVCGTLAQQMLLAVLARDLGDDSGADRLAGEIARWARALGLPRLTQQADSFLAGARAA
ncbi:hypothetical protein [Actinoplanes derwentensis]|uniref:Uncharacterized protein n=1 Tax=Actinoplanes derwentensis TaxID=113562 RepID=A0A1H1Z5E9_9ACTN|nr:hypothetical protein [Actinoplanes derwentensis]GID81443.1 hypothetical protein Ade03nite_03670 [Actinoplanes derwentensis]SDT28981.1 hypothetical protein SAMN04489716_3151 [Actinoplanes derwentensis]